MQLCKSCHIDRDRCDCDTKEKPQTIEQMVIRKIELDKEIEYLRLAIIRERIRLGQIL